MDLNNEARKDQLDTGNDWERVIGYGDKEVVTIDQVRSGPNEIVVESDLDSSLVGAPVIDEILPGSYVPAAAGGRSNRGRVMLRYQLIAAPENRPAHDAELDRLECFVNIMWDAVCMVDHFLTSKRSAPFGLGYSVLCLKGYGDPHLVVLHGAEPARQTPGVEVVRQAILLRNDQFQSDARDVARRLQSFIAGRLFPHLTAALLGKDPTSQFCLDAFRTLREDRRSIIRSANVAAAVLRYFRDGNRWDKEFINTMRAAFALGPWSRYFCPISETLVPPQHGSTIDDLVASLSEGGEPAEELITRLTQGVDGRRCTSSSCDAPILGPALKQLRDTSASKVDLPGRTHW